MRVAYLFAESYPDYDLDLKLFRSIAPDELKGLNTLVCTGTWRFFAGAYGPGASKPTLQRLMHVFYPGSGCMFSLGDGFKEAIETTEVYTAQFMSLRRSLVLALHKGLQSQERYLGFTQVSPGMPVHRQVFGGCKPRYQVERGRIYVLYSEFDGGERRADEIIDWWREESPSLAEFPLISALSKRDIGLRHTAFDAQEDPRSDWAIQIALQQLGDEWEVQSERTIYALQHRAPDALQEFLAATEVLSKPELTPADGAKIAVNLRRALEHLTRFVCPDDGKEKREWVRRRWGDYCRQNREKLGKYGDLLVCEAVGADRAISKLEAMYQMGNKGVHEDWDPQIFRGIVLRLLLLMDAVISLKLDHRTVRLDRALLDQHLIDD